MKRFSVILFAICLSSVHAEEGGSKTKKNDHSRITSQDIAAKRDQLKREKEKTKNKTLSKGIKTQKTNLRGTISRSTLLYRNGYWSRIPQGSILYTPAHLKKNIILAPKGKILTWGKFFIKNSGWLHTYPVNIDQARGVKSINPDAIKAYKSMGKIVVATYYNAPISVLPEALKPQPEPSIQKK